MDDAENLLAECGPPVWRTICRLLGSQEGAADCFQEAFVQFAKLARARAVQNPPALLKRIATRRAIDEVRRRAVKRRRERELDEHHTAGEVEPWEAMAAGELSEGLRIALREIPPDQAEVFCLTQLEDLDNTQAAAAMGIDPAHAAVLLHRARAALRKRLADFSPATRKS